MANKIVSIGGQALIEGIMMKSPEKYSIAVRKPDGEIDVQIFENNKQRYGVAFKHSVAFFMSSVSICFMLDRIFLI